MPEYENRRANEGIQSAISWLRHKQNLLDIHEVGSKGKKIQFSLFTNLKQTSLFLGVVQRCTRVENPGEGVPEVFCCKILSWSRLSGKITPYFGLHWIFINKCLEICLEGSYFYPQPPGVHHLFLSLHTLTNLKFRSLIWNELINSAQIKLLIFC